MGYQTQAIFKITLHKKDFNLLSQVKDYFGVGTITKHGSTTIEYRVKSLKDLDVILAHFEKYPLIFDASYSVRKIEVFRKKRGYNKMILSHLVQNPRIFSTGYSVRKREAHRK
jgi:hypothetical protein